MTEYTFDLIVIGAGPGGLEGALQGARNGFRVALVSNSPPGGRATWSSLLPSKVWLATAGKFDELKQLQYFGMSPVEGNPDLDRLRERIHEQSRQAAARYGAQLEQQGIRFIRGNGRITGPGHVLVTDDNGQPTQLKGRNILIASGSGPRFLPELKPNKDHIIAPKLSPSLPKVPDSLIMAGGGITGSEYAYAFAALGSRVTVLHNGQQLVPRIDEEVSEIFERWLQNHYEISLHKGDAVKSMQQEGQQVLATTRSSHTYTAEYGFIAIGRIPDLSFYDPAGLPLELTPAGMVSIDEYSRTGIPGIYAAGDVTGTPMTANRATMQARIAISHMKHGTEGALQPGFFIEAAYTNPPIAQIGDMRPESGHSFQHRRFNELLKANILSETEGLLKIKVDNRTNRIKGAAGFGAHMTDVLAVIQVAMNNDLPVEKIQSIPFAHPSFSEVVSM